MRMIETTAVIGMDRKLVLQLPSDVSEGEHRVIVVLDEPVVTARLPQKFSDYSVGLVDPTFSYRREDLYGDDGR